MNKRKETLILIFSIFLLFSLNYKTLDGLLIKFLDEKEYFYVERVIDGDTVSGNNKTIRLLGINAPEKNEPYYEEAKKFLEKEVLNKTVSLKFEKEKKDKYGRTLAYLFLNEENINLKSIENGFSNYYFPSGRSKEYNNFKKSWLSCLEKNINLCERSDDVCAYCIKIVSINSEEDTMGFYNFCDFSCNLENWTIKNEGRKRFIFPKFVVNGKNYFYIFKGNNTNSKEVLFWPENDILVKDSDSLFLRDSSGKLVDWKEV
ncbi:MAG: hypothetical protein KatS3mg093_431 [Candidatus Parcubacteria bacterium]|nr:MAG: hypothetical protein KatS3mg001_526 [Candidatus Pacearchaeota archaeon]GIW65452.1 MAG: hypothetical protein KatS3mg093_431 [Candidatus Parcubacteria bacterium]